MKIIILAVAIGLFATGAQAESCGSLQSEINQLMADANNADGICQAAQLEVRLYDAAARYNQYCVSGGGAQANEYYRARNQAQQTANASCD